MSQKKAPVTIEDLKLSPEEMEALIVGARAILPASDPQEDETYGPMIPLTGAEKTGP